MNPHMEPKIFESENGDSLRRVKLFFHGEAETPAERMAAIRQLRKGQILNYLLRNGCASRVDLSRALGFNLRTVSLLVSSLIEDDLLKEKPVAATKNMGRRPVPLELNHQAASVMAIDVRREKTAMALLDLKGHVLVRAERECDFGDTPEEQEQWLVKVAREFLAGFHHGLPPLAGVGLSTEGFVFRQHVAHHHAGVTSPIREALQADLDVPVCSDTDSRLVAIAEQWFGDEARGSRDVVILNISDGLGAGFVVDGKVMDGLHGFAGEIGHIPLGDSGLSCHCGSKGCLENIVSGTGLKRLAAQYGIVDDAAALDAREVVESILRHPKGRVILDKFIHHLALAVTISENLFDPGRVVLGGPIAPLIAPLHGKILEHLDKMAVPFIRQKTRVGFSTLGEDAILLGAAGQILNHIYSASHVTAESLL